LAPGERVLGERPVGLGGEIMQATALPRGFSRSFSELHADDHKSAEGAKKLEKEKARAKELERRLQAAGGGPTSGSDTVVVKSLDDPHHFSKIIQLPPLSGRLYQDPTHWEVMLQNLGFYQYVHAHSTAWVPLKPAKGETFLTFGWVMIMNVFFRSCLVIVILHFTQDNVALGLAYLSIVWLCMTVLLCVLRPYKDTLISAFEGWMMTCFATLAWAGALKGFLVEHQYAERYGQYVLRCDQVVNGMLFLIIISVFIIWWTCVIYSVIWLQRQRNVVEWKRMITIWVNEVEKKVADENESKRRELLAHPALIMERMQGRKIGKNKGKSGTDILFEKKQNEREMVGLAPKWAH
jgi:hypothetical protein